MSFRREVGVVEGYDGGMEGGEHDGRPIGVSRTDRGSGSRDGGAPRDYQTLFHIQTELLQLAISYTPVGYFGGATGVVVGLLTPLLDTALCTLGLGTCCHKPSGPMVISDGP